jgi:hypothetical protein
MLVQEITPVPNQRQLDLHVLGEDPQIVGSHTIHAPFMPPTLCLRNCFTRAEVA